MKKANNTDLNSTLLSRAYRLVAIRPRSEQEVRRRLTSFVQRKKLSPLIDTIDKVIAALKERKLIDDLNFSEWVIESRLRRGSRGSKFIRQELERLGVSKPIIAQTFSQILDKDMEKRAAITLLKRKLPDLARSRSPEARQRGTIYLLQRGFANEAIYGAIDEVLGKK